MCLFQIDRIIPYVSSKPLYTNMAKWKITMFDRKKHLQMIVFFPCHASFEGCMCHQNPGKNGLYRFLKHHQSVISFLQWTYPHEHWNPVSRRSFQNSSHHHSPSRFMKQVPSIILKSFRRFYYFYKARKPWNRVVDLTLNQAAKPWFHQYLVPAWYHLWRIVSENVLRGQICNLDI